LKDPDAIIEYWESGMALAKDEAQKEDSLGSISEMTMRNKTTGIRGKAYGVASKMMRRALYYVRLS
jgi:hypothetical protein